MQADYRSLLQADDWSWIERETDKRGGEDAFYEFRGQILLSLYKLKPGSYFDISKAKPENQEMFVKICCEFLTTHLGVDYRFNRLINKIYRDEPNIFTAQRKAKALVGCGC